MDLNFIVLSLFIVFLSFSVVIGTVLFSFVIVSRIEKQYKD